MSTPEALVIVVTMQLKPGTAERAIAAFSESIAATHTESGCLKYALHRDIQDGDRMVFVEHWASEDALAEHLTTPAVALSRATLAEVLAAPPTIVRTRAVPFGDPQKGAL